MNLVAQEVYQSGADYQGSIQQINDITLDNNDNIYIVGQSYNYDLGQYLGIFRKYNANYGHVWESSLNGDNAYITDIEHDHVNNLIYISGAGTGMNYNPLGEAYTVTNPDNNGAFFGSYNTDGILQSVHIYANTSLNYASGIRLKIVENRLLISGTPNYYPDLDVTSEQFYPIENYGRSGGLFLTIYGLEGGLELNGLYFFNQNRQSDLFLNGNNLVRIYQSAGEDSQLYGYNDEIQVDRTNISNRNDSTFGNRTTGIISYNIN